MVLCFYCLFSYHSLLELHYGGRIKKSQTAREQARETGLSMREVEWRIDAELFLDEYPGGSWELLTGPLSCTRCSCMLLSEDRKRQKDLSTEDAKVVHQNPT